MSEKPKVVILCSGKGTRFHESIAEERKSGSLRIPSPQLTRLEEMPKSMAPVGGIPLAEHLVRSFAMQGFTDFIFIVKPGELIRRHFQQPDFSGWRTDFETREPKQTVLEKLVQISGKLGETFILALGDSLTNADANKLLAKHEKSKNQITAASRKEDRHFAGIAAVQAGVLSEEGNAKIKEYAREEEGLFTMIQELATAARVDKHVNMNRVSDWAALNRMWDEGHAFWRGAYAKKIPRLPTEEITELLRRMPYLGTGIQRRGGLNENG